MYRPPAFCRGPPERRYRREVYVMSSRSASCTVMFLAQFNVHRLSHEWRRLKSAADRGEDGVWRFLGRRGITVDPVTPWQEVLATFLISLEINPSASDRHGWRPIAIAAYNDDVGMVDFLFRLGARTASRSGPDKLTPVMVTALDGRFHMARYLLALERVSTVDFLNPDGMSAFHMAVIRGDEQMVRLFHSAGADVTVSNAYGLHPFISACIMGHEVIVRFLLSLGASITYRDHEGFSPLMAAAAAGQLHIVRLLHRLGSSVNETADAGQTALSCALDSENERLVSYLLSHGADAEEAFESGRVHFKFRGWYLRRALHRADESGDLNW